MDKQRIHFTPTANTSDMDEFYFEMNNDWQEKARKLQARRWRMLRRSMRGD